MLVIGIQGLGAGRRHIPGMLRQRLALGCEEMRHADLVTDDLHSGCEVEGAVFRVGRYVDVVVTLVQLFIGKATVLPPEDHRHLMLASLLPYTLDRKSTRLNSSHVKISYAVFCLKKKKDNSL